MSAVKGWRQVQLGAVIRGISDGGTPDTNKKEYFGGDVPWVVIQDICREIRVTRNTLTQLGLNSCSSQLWPTGTVILSTGATIGEVGIAMVPVATKQGIHGIVCDDVILNEFLYYKLQTLRAYLNSNAQGSTIREIRANFIKTICIDFPTSILEQTKIAEILSTVDMAIEQTETLIAKQQRIKAGLMQDLFTKGIDKQGNLRSESTHKFKDSPLGRIPVEWEVEPIEHRLDCIIDYRGRTPSKTEAGIPLITAKNVRDGYISEEPREYIASENYNSWMTRGIPASGDVIITTEAPMGNVARIPDYKIALAQRLITLPTRKSRLSSDFLFWLLHWKRSLERLELLTSGSTVVGIKQSTFRKVLFSFPPIDEQLKMATQLEANKLPLNCNLKKLAKLRSLKTALMQDLLAGTKRVSKLLQDHEC